MAVISNSKVVAHVRHGEAYGHADPFLQFRFRQALQPDGAVLDGKNAL